MYIFIWSLFNFLGLVIENLAKSWSKYFYRKALLDVLSPQNKQRFECTLSSPLLAFSAISNFYFFAGEEIGHMYFWRVFQGIINFFLLFFFFLINRFNPLITFPESWGINLLLLFILYCCCQTSSEIKRREKKCLSEMKRTTIIKNK